MPTLSDEELLALMASRELAAAMARRFALTDKDDLAKLRTQCIRLHNSGAWDLLNLIEHGEIQALDDSDFFMASHFLGELLPDLELDPFRLIDSVEALVARGGSDMAANQPNAALRAWCARDSARSRALLQAALAGEVRAARNLTFALEALQSPDEARRLLSTDNEALIMSAITALGRIPDTDAGSQQQTLNCFHRLANGGDDRLKASVLHSTAFILSQDGASVGEFEISLLRMLTADAGEKVIHASAREIWAQRGVRVPEIFPILLEAAGRISAENKGSLKELDRALSALCESGHGRPVIKFLQDLIVGCPEFKLSEFQGLLQTLAHGPPDLYAYAVITWLLGGESRICEALAETIGPGQDEAHIFAAEDAARNLSEIEQVFVCRKAIGWLFMKPRSAASIVISVLRVCSEDVSAELQGLLISPLLLNYGGLREYLASIKSDDAAHSCVDAALTENDHYLAGLRSVPEIKELIPSESQRLIQHLRVVDQSREIAKLARKKSVLMSLFKQSTLLHGRRSLIFVPDRGGGLRRVETDLHSHEISFELPRLEIIDPVGLDYTLRVFRGERLIT